MKKPLHERFQQLAGIKPLYEVGNLNLVTEQTASYTASATASNDPDCFACINNSVSTIPLSQITYLNNSNITMCGWSVFTNQYGVNDNTSYYVDLAALNNAMMAASGSTCGAVSPPPTASGTFTCYACENGNITMDPGYIGSTNGICDNHSVYGNTTGMGTTYYTSQSDPALANCGGGSGTGSLCTLSDFENAAAPFSGGFSPQWVVSFYNKFINHSNGCQFLNNRLQVIQNKLDGLVQAGTNPNWQNKLSLKIQAIQAMIAQCCPNFLVQENKKTNSKILLERIKKIASKLMLNEQTVQDNCQKWYNGFQSDYNQFIAQCCEGPEGCSTVGYETCGLWSQTATQASPGLDPCDCCDVDVNTGISGEPSIDCEKNPTDDCWVCHGDPQSGGSCVQMSNISAMPAGWLTSVGIPQGFTFYNNEQDCLAAGPECGPKPQDPTSEECGCCCKKTPSAQMEQGPAEPAPGGCDPSTYTPAVYSQTAGKCVCQKKSHVLFSNQPCPSGQGTPPISPTLSNKTIKRDNTKKAVREMLKAFSNLKK